MNPIQQLQMLLAGLGVRHDDNATLFLDRELRKVKAQTYDVVYQQRRGRTLFPIDSSGPEWVKTVSYKQFDKVGKAKLITNYGADFPNVGLSVAEFSNPVVACGDGYAYSVDDIAAAIGTGMPLDAMLAQVARDMVENLLDDWIAEGVTEIGTKGVLNHASIPVIVLPNTGAFDTLAPSEIIENLNHVVTVIRANNKQTFDPDTLLLPTNVYSHIAQTPIAIDNQNTILNSFKANNPYIKNVEEWNKCDGAGATGKDRLMCYQRSKRVIEINIPMEFKQFAPQQRNLEFFVPAYAKFGGVELHYAKAAGYADMTLFA